MDLSNLEEIYTPSWLNPIVEHTAFVFIAQNPDLGEDPKVVNFTRHFNSQWEELRENLAKTGYRTDMPHLM